MRDVERRFRFTAIQSSYGTRLAQAFGIDPDDPDTNAVVHGGVAYFKSDAALTVLSQSAGMGLGAQVALGAEAVARRRVQPRRAQSLPDLRKV